MDEDDQSAAEAHQMELEQREQEETISYGRRLLAESRRGAIEFERECEAHRARVTELYELSEL